jgi:crossover junction endodeoxyribonuclease RusA
MIGGQIELPWPPKELGPNSRLHWRAVYKAKNAYKLECATTLRRVMPPRINGGRIALTITFYPPDRRRRDRDNLQASLKYGLDCVAKWLGVDDYLFDPTYHFAEPVSNARVVITISEVRG